MPERPADLPPGIEALLDRCPPELRAYVDGLRAQAGPRAAPAPAADSVAGDDLYREALKGPASGKVVVDPATLRYVRANRTFCEIVGRTEEELLGLTFADLTHPSDRAGDLDLYRRLLAGEFPAYSIEKRYLRPDGSAVWARVTCALGRDGQGRPLHSVGVIQDITDRRRAEEELADREALLRTLGDNLPGALYQAVRPAGSSTRFRHISAGIERLLGVSPSAVIADPAALFGLIHPDDLPRVVAAEEQAVAAGAPFDCEFRSVTAAGDLKWLHCRSAPRLLADGTGVYDGIVMDVTARKEAEEALLRFQHAIDHATDLVFYADPDGRLVYANRAAVERLGRTPADLAGATVMDFDAVLDLEKFRELGRALARGPVPPYETVFHGKDGSSFPVELAVSRVDFGGRTFVCGIARDVTERHRAEEALRESERRFATLAELVPQLVWTAGPGGAIDYFNGRWFDYTGSTPGESFGSRWSRFLHDEDRPQTLRRWEEALRTGQPFEVEYRLRGAGGRYEWFLARGLPLRDARGRVTRWFGTFTNIEGQKQAQAALREADRRKDEFLAMLAHELRNPLAPILTAAQVLGRAGPADPLLVEQQRVIDRQVRQMKRLLDDLLDVSRILRGKVRLRKERVELAAVLAEAVEASRPLLDAKRHRLELDLPAAPVPLHADPARLAQVFTNLLNNAAKFTDEDGLITLSVQTHPASPGPGPADGPGPAPLEVVARVTDTGVGMTPEVRARAFDLFEQADGTLDRSQGGLGIGLTLVKNLVEMHGGSVEAASDGPGKGSQFTVRLPLATGPEPGGPARPARPATPAAGERRQGLRVLVVDDNADAARSLAVLLGMHGHTVRVAHTGAAALKLADGFRPEAVVLDIGLPEMDGYEVARRLRGQAGGGPTLLIALTGYSQDRDRRLASEAGFDHHLVKPVDVEELQALLVNAR